MSEVSESSHNVELEDLKSSESPSPPLYEGQQCVSLSSFNIQCTCRL